MSEFTRHTKKTAPKESLAALQYSEDIFGFTPNLMAVLAESPSTINAYLKLNNLFEKTSYTSTERQIIMLTISRYANCDYCLAAHSTISKMLKVANDKVNAVIYGHATSDPKLEPLRIFTHALVEKKGQLANWDLTTFYQAGYNKQQVLEVILAISFMTLSHYVNHINNTAVDMIFAGHIPDYKPTSLAA